MDTVRVMVVDDNADVLAALAAYIDATPGLSCVARHTSADGLAEAVSTIDPDVLVLDATMPGADPLEALGALTRAHARVRTIVFSGRGDQAVRAQSLRAGACACLVKAADPDKLIAAIRQAGHAQTA